jgi:hypothetical protein
MVWFSLKCVRREIESAIHVSISALIFVSDMDESVLSGLANFRL